MRSYLIRGDRVTVFADTPTSIPSDGVLVNSIADLTSTQLSGLELVALWNGLPGAEPFKRFKDRSTGIKRLWSALELCQFRRPGPIRSKRDC